jgi:hypothetical protein
MHRSGRAVSLLRTSSRCSGLSWKPKSHTAAVTSHQATWNRKYSVVPPSSTNQENFLSGNRLFDYRSFRRQLIGNLLGNLISSSYVDEMFSAWSNDPKSVHPSWDAYFRGMNYTPPPSLGMTRYFV